MKLINDIIMKKNEREGRGGDLNWREENKMIYYF